MPSYDRLHFEPPAPVALVTLRNPISGRLIADVPMLLDSGADVSLIPRSALAPLDMHLTQEAGYELMGFDGKVSLAQVVQLDMIFCKLTFRGQFLILDQAWGIMGRNILNAVPLIFDGPNLTWDESLPR